MDSRIARRRSLPLQLKIDTRRGDRRAEDDGVGVAAVLGFLFTPDAVVLARSWAEEEEGLRFGFGCADVDLNFLLIARWSGEGSVSIQTCDERGG